MKKVKLFPAPHVEIKINMSEEMEGDIKTCTNALRSDPENDNKKCAECSWNEVIIEGVPCCTMQEVVRQVTGGK